MTCYLLHFNQPFVGTARNPNAKRVQSVQHYIGQTDNLPQRLAAHRAGHGARLLEIITEAGMTFEVARVWEGPNADKKLERHLKNQHNARRLCPICLLTKDATSGKVKASRTKERKNG